MTKRHFLPALVILVSCATQPDAESTAVAVIGTSESEATFAGDSYMFALTTPHGWVADDEVARSAGIDGVFYPAGSSWNGPVAIYPRVWQKDSRLSYEDIIAEDLQHYRSEAPDVQYQEAQAVAIPAIKRNARIRTFQSEALGVREAVAYIDHPLTVTVIVLRSATASQFGEAMIQFQELVRSYRPLLFFEE